MQLVNTNKAPLGVWTSFGVVFDTEGTTFPGTVQAILGTLPASDLRDLNKIHRPGKIGCMKIGAFELVEPLPEMHEPHVLAIVRPWVNVGRVGTLVLARLEHHFGANTLGKLDRPGYFYDFTRYRPRSRFVEGRRETLIPNSTISLARTEESQDFLLFNLREPHAHGEDYVDSIVELLKTLGVTRYSLIGGMYDVVPHTRPLLVSGASSTDKTAEEAKKARVQETTYQGPTSITSLITQEARKLSIEHMSFVVHLPQYVQLDEDYAGAARLMELLCSMYGLPPHLVDQERGQKQYGELTAAVERNPELKAVLQQLESQYDSRQVQSQEPTTPPTPLSPEVEKFLQELGERSDTDTETE